MKFTVMIWLCFVLMAAACVVCIGCALAIWPAAVLMPAGLLGLSALGGLLYFNRQIIRGIAVLADSLGNSEKPLVAGEGIMAPLVSVMDTFRQKTLQALEESRKNNQELSLQLQLLRRRKLGVEAILNSIYDAVLVIDAQDRLVLANPAAERLLAISTEHDTGKPIQEILAGNPLVENLLKTRTSRVRHVRREFQFQTENGPAWFDCLLSCVSDETDQISSVVAVLHDVTREKEISQAKNDFVSHVSHELKTPLASINAYAEMLVDGEAKDEESLHEFCGIIQGQAQRLNRLIEDILNISRIESGLMKVHKQNHSMALIIRDAVEMMKSYAQEKNITVHAPATILCDQITVDRDMMMQVVINLLSNAVKYTPAGGSVTITSELNEIDGLITVSVTDTGIGIPEQDIGKLFGKFFRVEANKNFAKGTGLGLNLVRQIVETLHNGQVFVRSKQGQGSTFGFILPLTTVQHTVPA